MNSVKINLVLLVSVVFLGCSGLGQVKDNPDNKIQGQWRIFSQEFSQKLSDRENWSEDFEYKYYSLIGESYYLTFNNNNEIIRRDESNKDKYFIEGDRIVIKREKKDVVYNFLFEKDMLVIYLSDKDTLKFKRVNKISEISQPEKIPQMQPVLFMKRAAEKSDITLFEKVLSTKMKNTFGSGKIDFKYLVEFFHDKDAFSFVLEENGEKEVTIYTGNTCVNIGIDVIREENNWKIDGIFGAGGGCSGTGGGGGSSVPTGGSGMVDGEGA